MDGSGNESGLEEFVLWVTGGAVYALARTDHESEWQAYPDYADMLGGGTIVKAYAPPDWQMMAPRADWMDCVIIGYQERRLKEEEEEAIRAYVADYWNIPF